MSKSWVPNLVTLVIDVSDEHGQPVGDPDAEVMANLRPTWMCSAAPGDRIVMVTPVSVRMFGGEFATVMLAATDDVRFEPRGWQWEISFAGTDAMPATPALALCPPFDLRAADGPVQRLSAVLSVSAEFRRDTARFMDANNELLRRLADS